MKTRKKIPYALTNFESIRTENYLYVDKTRFIEMLENENAKYNFLIRPRKFGKTLFLSVLEHYYDVRFKERFQELFGDLYIGQHPTNKANSYFVIRFNFSGLDTSDVESFKISFTESIRNNIEMFFSLHRHILNNADDLVKQLAERTTVGAYIEFALKIINDYGKKAYVIIDEYDHFANDIIAKGTTLSKNQYQESVWANSITKDFYETLKIGTETVVDKIFVTGITPIMLDDLTSGFNISNNLSLETRYNEILGLTREEVDWVMEQINLDKSLITVDIEKMYNGYLFNKHATNKLFNSTMIFYYFKELLIKGDKNEKLIDNNLKTDYGRIRNLINQHGNKQKLRELLENDSITGDVVDQFSIELIHEDKNFFSLLFYMGLVTIDNSNPLKIALKIPNYSMKTMYWEFIERMLTEELEGLSLDNSKYFDAIYRLAYENTYEPFFEYFSKYIVSYLSNRDLQNTVEKDMKFLLLPIFFTSYYYFPISELENSEGYTDIYLKRGHLHPGSVSEWVWELKYIKQKDSKNKKLIAEKKSEAITRLQDYKSSNFFKDKNDVRYLAVVFVGKKDYFIEEV
ncbi:MAG: ATP-binding protein [Bacteroidales bacterium]|nr:ATP-binding protein [Bacteroidales bacterium]